LGVVGKRVPGELELRQGKGRVSVPLGKIAAFRVSAGPNRIEVTARDGKRETVNDVLGGWLIEVFWSDGITSTAFPIQELDGAAFSIDSVAKDDK
jgi:hypothetical protein